MSNRPQTIEDQQAFVHWLKDNGLYNEHESATSMQKMHDVWVKMNQIIQPKLKQLKENLNESRVCSIADPSCSSPDDYREMCEYSTNMVENIQTDMDIRLDPYDDEAIRPNWEE